MRGALDVLVGDGGSPRTTGAGGAGRATNQYNAAPPSAATRVTACLDAADCGMARGDLVTRAPVARSVRFPIDALRSGEITLDRDASHRALKVLRLGLGDRVLLFDPDAQREADAEVVGVERGVTLRVAEPRPARALPARALVLVQGVGKGDKPERVLRDATALGATAVVFAVAARSVAQGNGNLRADRWRAVVLDVARQCGRGDVPEVRGPVAFEAALGALPRRSFLLDPGAEASLLDLVRALPPEEPVGLLIGPEGGWDPREAAAARACGVVAARIGSFVLRTETAATAALAVVGALAPARGER